MQLNQQTVINPNGLRYSSKQNGSPFQGLGSTGETLSCLKCGQHRLRRNGSFKRFLNSPMFFCFECKPGKAVPALT